MEAFDDETFGSITMEGEVTAYAGTWASVILTNLEEIVEAVDLGLPERCDEATITWLEN